MIGPNIERFENDSYSQPPGAYPGILVGVPNQDGRALVLRNRFNLPLVLPLTFEVYCMKFYIPLALLPVLI